FQVFAALLDVDVIPGQDLGHGTGALRVPGGVDAEIGKGPPPDVRLEAFAPAVQAAASPPSFLQRRSDPAVTASQHAVEETAFNVMLLDPNRPNLAALPHVLAGPLEILARLHAVPLVGGMRLGNKVGDGGCHFHETTSNLFADRGNVLGHVDNPVEIDRP